jgi:hypothetical protein
MAGGAHSPPAGAQGAAQSRGLGVSREQWLILLAAALAMIAAAVYKSISDQTGAQGRYVYPVQGAIAALTIGGLFGLAPQRWHRHLGLILWAALASLAAISTWRWLPQAYALPPRLAAADLPAGRVPLSHRYGDSVRLHGFEVSAPRTGPGGTLEVTLYWETAREIDLNYAVFLQLVDGQSNKVAQHDTYSGNGMYPTSRWKPGEIIVDRLTLSVDANAPAPQVYWLIGGLWDVKSGQRLPLRSGDPAADSVFRLGEVAVIPEAAARLPGVAVPLVVQYESGITLRGCGRPGTRPGTVTTFWEATQSVGRDYTVLVHLWDASGEFIAGLDHPPMQGRFPSRFWQAGDWIADEFILPDTAAIDQLNIGFYTSDTLERLPLLQPPLPDGLLPLPGICWKP